MYNNDPRYTNPPEAGLASLLASRGRNGDSVLVHMAPEEAQGLQSLAVAHGGSLTVNPHTGALEASFLKKILPQIAGAVLTGGFGMNPFTAAATVGAVTGLVEGDLQKGLMAGLGAYSGANIAGAFKAAGTPTAPPETGSTVKTEAPPTPKFGAVSTKDQILYGAQGPRTFDVDPLARQNWAASNTPTGAAPIQAQTTVKPPSTSPSGLGALGQGVRNVFTGQEGAGGKFMEALGGPLSKYATFAGAMIPFAEEPKPLNVPGMGEETFYVPGGFNPLYGTGADQPYQLPGKYYKRTKKGVVPINPWGPTGMAAGGPVQTANQDMNMPMPYPHPNQNYPLSTVVKANYSPQYLSNVPQPREVLSGYDTKVDPFTGEEKFAAGGEATTTTQENPNVVANRKYVEELNRRALNPVVNPYGMNFAGGLGGTNTPWTGTNPYGGPLTPPAGGTTGGSTGGGAGDVAAFLATQVGMNWMMQPGNALALKNWISGGMKWADRPFLNADKTAGTGTGTNTGTGQTGTQTGGDTTGQTQTGGDTTGQTQTGSGEGTPRFDPVKGIVIAGGTSAAAIAAAKALAAQKGVLTVTLLDGTVVAGGGAAAGAGAGVGAAGAATGGTGAATGGTGAATTGAGAGGGAGSSIGSTLAKAAPYAALALGAQQAYQGISKGREGQAALGGGLAGAGGAALAGTGGFGSMAGLAALGPAALIGAGIAAIGASLVNTKEQGDIALRNYWKAVDQGRGLGSAPPEELANGFINFYRTNKNEFAGQEKYGRKGNEDFVYDMTQIVNNAVDKGIVSKDASAEEIYKKAVQPWLNTMGSGPKDPKARAIQDFMMTDLIYNFMQGKPISNAQVKGDKNYKIVSQKPVFAGNAPAVAATKSVMEEPQYGAGMGAFDPYNPYGATMQFADGGAIGEDYNFGFAQGGMPEYKAGGKLLDGPGDGMSDSIPAVIRGKGVQRAALADGEFVIPADVVSHLGNGSTKAGAKKLYQMMAQVRKARTGKTRQAPAVKTDRFLPA